MKGKVTMTYTFSDGQLKGFMKHMGYGEGENDEDDIENELYSCPPDELEEYGTCDDFLGGRDVDIETAD